MKNSFSINIPVSFYRGNVSNQTYVSTPTVASYTLQNSGPTSPAGSSTSGGGGQVIHVYNHSWSKLRHQNYSTV